ncbi:hypothetical protein [Streptomyces sp. NPDC058745]|uniref:hypothetical protein n=1 Tax=unclassified Streptomyces TaxID=2593676 RepID=UPI0036C1519B
MLTYSANRKAWRHAASCASKCLDAIRLGVLGARFLHGGFPVDALLAGCFDLVETSVFGGFAVEGDLRSPG